MLLRALRTLFLPRKAQANVFSLLIRVLKFYPIPDMFQPRTDSAGWMRHIHQSPLSPLQGFLLCRS